MSPESPEFRTHFQKLREEKGWKSIENIEEQLESHTIGHMGLGYHGDVAEGQESIEGRLGNQLKTIEHALEKGEDVEFDLRIVDGQVVLYHDQPQGTSYPSFEKLLVILKRHPKAGKICIDIKGGEDVVIKVFEGLQNADMLEMVQGRLQFFAFNPNALVEAHKLFKGKVSLYFNYYPIDNLTRLAESTPALLGGITINKAELKKRAYAKTPYKLKAFHNRQVDALSVHVREKNMLNPSGEVKNERFYFYDDVPLDEHFLNILADSGGGVNVPWSQLVKDRPKPGESHPFFRKIREAEERLGKNLRVGVWFEEVGLNRTTGKIHSSSQMAVEIKQHRLDIVQAWLWGADTIITNHPDFIQAGVDYEELNELIRKQS